MRSTNVSLASGLSQRDTRTAGDTITAFDGHAVSSPDRLTAFVLAKKPDARVSVRYIGQSGAGHSTTVTLGSGPPR